MYFRAVIRLFCVALIALISIGFMPVKGYAQPATDLLPVPEPVIVNGPVGGNSAEQPASASPLVQEAPAESVTEVIEAAPAQDVLLPVPVEPAASGAAPAGPIATAVEVPAVPAMPPAKIDENTLFFDSEALVPEGEMKTGVPREVNPAVEPGSKLIVVTRDSEPNSMQARLVSAQRAMILGRYDSALRLYNELYQKNKKDPNVLLGRAIALQKIGNTDSAIQAYQELLDVRPGNVDAELNMLGLMGQQYPAVALQRLLDLRDRHPDNAGILAQIAFVQGKLGQYQDAIQSLGMAAAIDNKNAGHLYNMAVLADRMGDKSKAIQYYQDALETDTIYAGSGSIPREAVYERLAQIR
jgi:Flp pilus assembly protein TadD